MEDRRLSGPVISIASDLISNRDVAEGTALAIPRRRVTDIGVIACLTSNLVCASAPVRTRELTFV